MSRADAPTPLLLDIPVRSSICPESACAVATELIKHYLYMFGQAPGLVDNLLTAPLQGSKTNGDRRRTDRMVLFRETKAPRRNRRMDSFVGSIQAMLGCVTPRLISLATGGDSCCRLLYIFGPTPTRPKWVIDVRISPVSSCLNADLKRPRAVSRTVVRRLVMATSEEPGTIAGSTKLYIMLPVPTPGGESPAAPAGFRLQRSPRLLVRKARWLTLAIHPHTGPEAPTITPPLPKPLTDRPGSRVVDLADNSVEWFLCQHAVKGVACQPS
mmetsp:Transcript_15368/g.42977  ORF Transcript_15368/g.42977 Transcript_15368/m.42977 type:complete len:270 (+) Transcript_15368:124-933(+)